MINNYFWASLEVVINVSFQFISLVVLSKILKPEDYGVLGCMTIFVSLGNMLVDSGMGSSLIRKIDATNKDYFTLFTFNLFVSLFLYLILFLFSPLIADFYDIPVLKNYIRVYSLIILISSFGIVQMTQLVKDLRFKKIALISCVSNLCSLFIAFCLAYNGFGVWALIYQQIVYILVRVILLFAVNRFVPSLKFSYISFKEQFTFGISILCSNIVNTIYMNIVSSIIPKISTTIQNGFYTQANKIQNLPVSIVSSILDKVVFPVLTKCSNIHQLFVNSRLLVRKITLFSFVFISSCVIFSDLLVRILLGSHWLGVIPYLQVLLFSGFPIIYIVLARSVFKAIGKTTIIMVTELCKSFIGIAIIFMFIFKGVWGIIIGFVLSSYLTLFIVMFFLQKHIDYTIKMQLLDLKYSIAIWILTVVCFVCDLI